MLGGLFIAVTLFLPKGIVGTVPAFASLAAIGNWRKRFFKGGFARGRDG
jgi:urea transport system permease protein